MISTSSTHTHTLSQQKNNSLRGIFFQLASGHPVATIILTLSLLTSLLIVFRLTLSSGYQPNSCPYKWAGGSPAFNKGSCWCGEDGYCMCTPSLAIDVMIEVMPNDYKKHEKIKLDEVNILLVYRKHPPPGHAIPGGFVDVGETVEDACIREMKEEINLSIEYHELELFKIYSNPKRDKRRHTVSAVHVHTTSTNKIRFVKGADDAKEVRVVPMKSILDGRTVLDLDLELDLEKGENNHLKHVRKAKEPQDNNIARIGKGKGKVWKDSDSFNLAFDHEEILVDFIKQRCKQGIYDCV